jgi:hypothetical protein
MLEACGIIKKQTQHLRTEEMFISIFEKAVNKGAQYDLDPLSLRRPRGPPKRFTGPADHHEAKTPEEHYRSIFFALLDSVLMQMNERFDLCNNGLREYHQLEEMLLLGKVNSIVVQKYPELQAESFPSQLEMFKHTTKATSLHDAQLAYRKMSPDVRSLFAQVFTLMKLLLVCPVSSCECERTFSALRRLKTWLRQSMTQHRLNYVAVCHVHQQTLDDVSVNDLLCEFVSRSDIRRNLYGSNC